MKNLENYKIKKLTLKEQLNCEGGGSDPDGCSGCSAGRGVRNFLFAYANLFGSVYGWR
ncbi:hypothetical protein [uncultured Maribacter sp.]|uniref:hypothetical protein n=1 Tax=uncultured Maribacter sp. TaxID=431308 RepID=UPI0030EF4572